MRVQSRALSLLALAIVATTAAPSPAQEDPAEPADAAEPADDDDDAPPAAAPEASRGEDLTIKVLTFGPGDHPFYKFGHDAIWIHDAQAARDQVYNYGSFSFRSKGILYKFFFGRFRYWLSRHGIKSTLREYRDENRSILSQELDLPPAARLELKRKLEENAKPENKYYKYDYYRDNCSTRVRDVIDQATGGRLRAIASQGGGPTYREHTLRLTAEVPAENLVLGLVMGPLIDRPLTVWEEMFLPEKVAESLRRVRTPGPDGVERPLVKEEQVLFQADRAPPPERAPNWAPGLGAAGLVLGGALAGLGRLAPSMRAARAALGAVLAALGLALGFLGCFFLAAWAFTDHEVGYRNENTFQCAPWAIALLVTGVGFAFGSKWATRATWWIVASAAAASVLGLVLKVLPWFGQHNLREIAFFLPLWLGAAAALWLHRKGSAPRAPALAAPTDTPGA